MCFCYDFINFFSLSIVSHCIYIIEYTSSLCVCVCVGRTCLAGHFTYMWVWSRYGRRVGSHVDCRRLGGMVVVGLLLLRIGKEWMFGSGNVGGGSGHALFVCHFGFVGQHDYDTVIDMRNGVWSFGH